MKHFAAIAQEARRLSMPSRFATDLDVDRDVLAATADTQPFGWALRDSGTHLFMPGEQDGVGHTVDQFPRFVREAFGDSGPLRFYWWDGASLALVGEDKLRQLLTEAAND